MSVSVSLAETEAEGNPALLARWRRWIVWTSFVLPALLLYPFWLEIQKGPEGVFFTYFGWFFLAVLLWNFLLFGFFGLLRKWYGIRFPPRDTVRVLHEENYASGAEGGLGGHCHGCLVLIVTEDELWTTSWFPFTFLIAVIGLEHRIRKRDILEVQTGRFLFVKQHRITFRTSQGKSCVKISSKQVADFESALDYDSALRASGRWEGAA
ncbi:MAG: hypothetical protein AAGK14_08650 [Verrucomicrobiota bacterium]